MTASSSNVWKRKLGGVCTLLRTEVFLRRVEAHPFLTRPVTRSDPFRFVELDWSTGLTSRAPGLGFVAMYAAAADLASRTAPAFRPSAAVPREHAASRVIP